MATSSPLDIVLTDAIVRGLAGDRYYQRGVDYFRRKLVHSLECSGNIVEAKVSGTEDYAVRLSAAGRRFQYTCECPIGDEGAFCKHCVATALAWLAEQATPATSGKGTQSKPIDDDDIKAALSAQEKETLVDWLLECCQYDKLLRQKLVMVACLRNDPATWVAEVRQQLQDAIRIRGFVEYRQVPAYAAGVEAALDNLETLLRNGQAAPVIDLCEAANMWLDAAIGSLDDSNGQGTELMGRVADLHFEACEQAQPDPASLGLRLFALDKNSQFGQWDDAPERYAHLLGDAGLAAFRGAAAKEWAKVPVRTQSRSSTGEERFYSITRIMESLARQSGDVEQLVAVFERDLTNAPQYLRIADAYRAADKREKALQWAERGMSLYPGRDGASLRRLVAEEYRRSERHADALRILWSDFRESPHLASYKLLEDFARAADDWDDWRDRALAHIRRSLTEKPRSDESRIAAMRHQWNRSAGHSLLVEIFLHERHIEEAWREAQAGGCRDQLWLDLAAERETTHPEDAIGVYLRFAERSIADTSNGRYEAAMQLLEKAAALMHDLGKSRDFDRKLDALRQQFKAKRNLQKLAESRRRFLYLS